MQGTTTKILFHLVVGALVLGGLTSCRRRVRMRVPQPQVAYAQPQPQPQPPPQTVGAGVSASAGFGGVSVRIQGPSITAMQHACSPNAPEACNGLDDNCNGVIDEGCGFASGNIQITLAWSTGADLDLYVTDPSGYTISYSRTRSPSGGHLDHDARGACVRSQGGATIENVYWNVPRPPPGPYVIEVHNYSGCRVSNQTQGTLSIAVGGQVLGSYNVVLRPGERQSVAQFNMP